MSKRRVLIYGAGGRTGQSIARHARERGLDVVVAGRASGSLAYLAQSLRCEARTAAVDDELTLAGMLADVGVLINAAGPFATTASPIVKACVAARCHYIDVNGEVEAYKYVAEWDGDARNAGVLLMPGAGYCVVASTFILASLLADPDDKPSMREPTRVRIVFSGGPASSVGSIKSLYTSLGPGVHVVRDRKLTSVPIGSLERAFDFGSMGGRLDCTAISVADTLAVKYDAPPTLRQIESYVEGTLVTRAFFEASGKFTRFSKVQPWKAFVEQSMRQWPATPDSGVDTRATLRVEVDNPWLETRWGMHVTRSTYEFTALAACAIAELVLAGVGVIPGFHTPASLYAGHEALRHAFTVDVTPPLRTARRAVP